MRQLVLLAAMIVLLPAHAHAGDPVAPPNAESNTRLGRQCASGRETACFKLVRDAVKETDVERAEGAVWWLHEDRHLVVVARTAFTPGARLTAALHLADQTALDEIARSDLDPHVRETLLFHRKVLDQAVLAEIARTDPADWVRAQAVLRLTDPALLAAFGREDPAPTVREAAVHGITDPAVLAEIATTDTAEEPAARAASRLNDAALAREVARHAIHARARASAVEKLTDEAAVIDILGNDPAAEVCTAAFLRLERMLPRGALPFAEIAERHAIAAIRIRAVAQVTDAAVLARVGRGDADPDVRTAALQRVSDPLVVAEAARTDSNLTVRAAAVRILASMNPLPEPLASDRVLRKAIDRQRHEMDRRYRTYGWMPVLEAGYGSGTGTFGTVGLRHFEEGHSRFGPGWVVRLELGAAAGRLSLGHDFGTPLVGLAVNAALIKPWNADRTLVGGEADIAVFSLPFDIVHFRVGASTPLGALGHDMKLTWSVSANPLALLTLVAILTSFRLP